MFNIIWVMFCRVEYDYLIIIILFEVLDLSNFGNIFYFN